jgi:hypothetical protein
VRFGDNVIIPLLLTNNTAVDQEITLVSRVASGWTEAARPSRFRVQAHDISAIEIVVTAPAKQAGSSSVLTWEATAGSAFGRFRFCSSRSGLSISPTLTLSRSSLRLGLLKSSCGDFSGVSATLRAVCR